MRLLHVRFEKSHWRKSFGVWVEFADCQLPLWCKSSLLITDGKHLSAQFVRLMSRWERAVNAEGRKVKFGVQRLHYCFLVLLCCLLVELVELKLHFRWVLRFERRIQSCKCAQPVHERGDTVNNPGLDSIVIVGACKSVQVLEDSNVVVAELRRCLNQLEEDTLLKQDKLINNASRKVACFCVDELSNRKRIPN